MSLEKILSVAGKAGLFRLVGQMKNGIIVESIEDGKRFPVHGSSKVSALNEISIYTMEEEIPLKEIFKKIYEKQKSKLAPDHKSDAKTIKAFFESVLPDYDPQRVYASDMVKVLKWYNLLVEKDGYDPTKEELKEQEVEATEEKSEVSEAKPKKAAKKSAAKPKSAATPKAVGKAKTGSAVSTPRKSGGTSRGS